VFVDSATFDWWLILITNGLSSLLLGLSVLRWRYLLLKPSILFLGYYQLSVMWPALSWYPSIVQLVPNVRDYIWALHGFGFLATLVAITTWRRTARCLNRRMQHPSTETYGIPWLPITVLGSLLLVITACYLHNLGWRNTGLYAILSGSENTAEVREESLKLISSDLLRYGWFYATCSISYLLGYILARAAVGAALRRRYLLALMLMAAYGGILLMVMLPGARAPAAMVVLTTVFAYYTATGFKMSPAKLALWVAAALLAPSLISLLREDQPLTLSNVAIYYFDILDRVAGRSVEDNIWLVSYVQHNGVFGSSGIPALARLLHIEPVNIYNVVGLYFRPDGIQSISANSAFPTVNYACFGAGALWLSLLLTFAMDGLLWLQTGLPRRWLVPSCGICAMISINFAMTLYTTVFITHGLIFTIFTCYALTMATQLLRLQKTSSRTTG
jgi:hypothetical protein